MLVFTLCPFFLREISSKYVLEIGAVAVVWKSPSSKKAFVSMHSFPLLYDIYIYKSQNKTYSHLTYIYIYIYTSLYISTRGFKLPIPFGGGSSVGVLIAFWGVFFVSNL